MGAGGDFVVVKQVGYAQEYRFPVHCSWGPGYDTRNGTPATFPPGSYTIWVDLGSNSDCDKSFVQQVIHGSTDQEVDLTVLGKVGQPDGGGDE
jgi:hypothetical protein